MESVIMTFPLPREVFPNVSVVITVAAEDVAH